jgi:phage gp29-like protein
MAGLTTGLLGPDGQPIRKELLTQEIAAAEISGVRTPVTGYPADGLNPGRLASILKAADQGNPLDYFELAEQAEERDQHYTAVLGKRKRQVSKIPIRVEAASEDKAHVAQADFVRKWLTRDTLKAEFFDMLDAVGKGISFTEIIWDNSSGFWWPKKLEWRDPRWFTFDRNNLSTPLLRGAGAEDQSLPFGKFIVTRIQAKSGLPVRSGVARAALWGWMFKMFTVKDWAIFLQTYGIPLRLGRFPSGATAEEKRALLRAVTSIAGDAAAIIPQGMDLEILDHKTQGQSAEHFERRANWLDQQTSKLVLGQTATTDAIAGGHAVGKEHREVEGDLRDSDAATLQAVLNEQLMQVWIDLEFGPQSAYPRFIIEEPDDLDIPVISAALEKLVPLGLAVSMSSIRDKLGLDEPADDEDTLKPGAFAPPPQDPPQNAQVGKGPLPPPARVKPKLMAAEPATEADIADALEASSLDDWEELVSPIVAQVKRELAAATTMEDFRTRLQKLAAEVDVTAITEALNDAAVTATIAGFVGVSRTG